MLFVFVEIGVACVLVWLLYLIDKERKSNGRSGIPLIGTIFESVSINVTETFEKSVREQTKSMEAVAPPPAPAPAPAVHLPPLASGTGPVVATSATPTSTPPPEVSEGGKKKKKTRKHHRAHTPPKSGTKEHKKSKKGRKKKKHGKKKTSKTETEDQPVPPASDATESTTNDPNDKKPLRKTDTEVTSDANAAIGAVEDFHNEKAVERNPADTSVGKTQSPAVKDMEKKTDI
uniref:Uncharacterized protein n=1 Tax=Panagrolaimus sp. JU765 TaxID=591449 RepID=A0AC34RP53_9BILA